MNLIDYCNDMGYNTEELRYDTLHTPHICITAISYASFHLTVTGYGKNETMSRHCASMSLLNTLKLRALKTGVSASTPKNEPKSEKIKLKEYLDALMGCGNKFEYSTEDVYIRPRFRCTLSHPNFKFVITKYDENRKLAENSAAQTFRKFCEINDEWVGSHDLIIKD